MFTISSLTSEVGFPGCSQASNRIRSHEIAVEIGVVDDVPGAVDGCFESHHEVEFLVHRGLHQIDSGARHRRIEVVAVLDLA